MEKKSPFTTLKENVIFENHWMKVRNDDVELPDGEVIQHGVVDIIPGVAVLPVDQEGKVHLVREHRYNLGRRIISCVRGGIDDGGPDETAKRELEEEMGIIANKWFKLGEYDKSAGITNSPLTLYIATDLEFGKPNPEKTEHLERFAVSIDEAQHMIDEGKLRDLPTMYLITQAKRYL